LGRNEKIITMLTVVVGIKKRPAGAEELKWESLPVGELVALASTQALFGGVRTFVLVGALSGERGEEILDLAEVFVESPHTFIFEEEKLLKAPTAALEKAGAKIEVRKVEKKERGFDPFGLTAALAARDRKRLWLALSASLRAGEKAEAVAGLLAWKARAMGDANLSRQLTWMYHDSHRGAGDLELLLERFALCL
jgi:DNA polymerase III delta subunit